MEPWLGYQRHEFIRKLRDLDPEGLVAWAIPPVELSVLGLVRHMTQMEHVALTWGLGGGERVMAYGEDDYAGGSIETIDADLRAYLDRSTELIRLSPRCRRSSREERVTGARCEQFS